MTSVLKTRHSHPKETACPYFEPAIACSCIVGDYHCKRCANNKGWKYTVDYKTEMVVLPRRLLYQASHVRIDVVCMKEEEEKIKKMKEILK